MRNLPEIRADDVGQMSMFTSAQKEALKEKSMFEWFLEADAVFEKYNYPCTLAILSEGMDDQKWVDHIKENIHRYKIELHGSQHHRYSRFNKENLYEDLFKAKNLIEDTFGVQIMTWYVPFGRKCRSVADKEVCDLLGINLGVPNGKVDAKLWIKNKEIPHVNFHFWCRSQIKDVENILKTIYG